ARSGVAPSRRLRQEQLGDPWARAVDGERYGVSGRRGERAQRESSRLVLLAEKRRPLVERDVERAKVDGEPVAASLQIRLLAGPAAEERRAALARRKRLQRRDLRRREEVLGDTFAREAVAHPLDVDTNLASARERGQGKVPGTGKVDRERALVEPRLAEGAVREADAAWLDTEIPAGEFAEYAACGDEPCAVEAGAQPERPIPLVVA